VLDKFLPIVTHPPDLLAADVPAGGAAVVEALLASPTVRVLTPGDRFWTLLQEAVEEGQVSGNRIFDAQLVTSAGSTASGPSSRWTGTSDASRRSLFKRCELESQSQYIVVAVEIYGGRHDEAVGGDRR
jgi:hypothetical protein